ncbi:hypothetical protein U1Q18_024530 [Sarracenia purpurea var. burkii]
MEIIRSEGLGSDPINESLTNETHPRVKKEDFKKQGLQVVSSLSREFGNVKKAAGMDSDVLSSYVSKLEMGLEKSRKALSLVKEATEYFHGDAVKEEAHPFRTFMIVRDFLSILDDVCKAVGRMQDSTMGSARSFRIPATASLPVLNRLNVKQNSSSDEESLSP